MVYEHLERTDDLSEGDALVGLPGLCRLDVVNEDDEVLLLALVVDLDLLSFSTSHDCLFIYLLGWLVGLSVLNVVVVIGVFYVWDVLRA